MVEHYCDKIHGLIWRKIGRELNMVSSIHELSSRLKIDISVKQKPVKIVFKMGKTITEVRGREYPIVLARVYQF